MVKLKKVKLGFIPANRGFFSDKLAAKMRNETVKVLKATGAEVVVPSPTDTKVGCVESLDEAIKVGRMFREAQPDGIVVSAVNFGDEQGVAITLKECGLRVPVLIVGCQEEAVLSREIERRDSFCGLLSIGEALRQLGLPYSVPEVPICFPTDESFRGTAERFAAVCRVVGGIRSARYGQVGARPDAFWTCRYNEKALQTLGPTCVTLDLSEVIGAINAMPTDAAVKRVVADMKKTIDTTAVADDILAKIAKLEIVLRKFIEDRRLDGLAIQCWTSIQQNLGICTCATMGRFDDRGTPCACEADIMGLLSMHALMLASGGPSCLADWNNLHNEDPELVNCWHCGVFPHSWAKTERRMACHEIIAGTVGRDKAMGVVEFVMQDGPVTLCRATQDNAGAFKVALAQGVVEPNAAVTFGAYGWVRIPNFQRFYRNVLVRHFPHHVGMNRAHVGNVLWEAFGNYLGFKTYTAANTSGDWTPDLPFGV
ncbi:MAG TPA: L-fucose/L-arabinose isomerase family protein [Planctomycetota bacterium]|nr:L-fucose/L-arabinose isomerase family protein [Planctomycetota bacterium]HRR82180.1 L-fucose/L-arabinose isomerase family protein [Planctomycetota bacterium]HRT93886.1 L-fucose/L-arabinose isomerase family protein [Planctomycetota bacterium]